MGILYIVTYLLNIHNNMGILYIVYAHISWLNPKKNRGEIPMNCSHQPTARGLARSHCS